jgi:multiple sugar transport system permease protein
MTAKIISVPGPTSAPARKPRLSKMRLREELMGYLWTFPWWGGFLAFSAYPTLMGLYYSFTSTRWVDRGIFVGVQNYVTALTQDPRFWPGVGIMFYYAIAVVPLTMAASLFAATILNQKLKGENIFRTIFYIPSLMPEVALVVMWTWILNPSYGLMNQFLKLFGITGLRWLDDPNTAIPSLLIMATWGAFGGTSMLIFLSTLQSVPQELYESCDMDGGGVLAKFWFITVPMISPAIFFNGILGIIGAFSSFVFAYLAPAVPGGPNFSTYSLSLHIYIQGFQEGRLGYASAMSWMLFLIIAAIIIVNYLLSGRWLFMSSGDIGD